jgi:N-methylhydantoinase A
MFLARVDSVDREALEGEFGELEGEARLRLAAEDVPEEQMSIQRLVDMRYLGQWRSLTVPVSAPVDFDAAAARFHAEHQRTYNYRRDESPLEIYRLSVRATGVTPKPELRRHERSAAAATSRGARPVHFDSSESAYETPRFLRSELPAGAQLEGPAVIEQLDSTTLVPPGWRAEVDEWLNIRMAARPSRSGSKRRSRE